MKNWNAPEIKELTLSSTEAGHGHGYMDWEFKDQWGNVFQSHSGNDYDIDHRENREPVDGDPQN